MVINKEIEKKVFNLFKCCIERKMNYDTVVVKVRQNIYYFNKSKLEDNFFEISSIGLLIDNFDKGIDFFDINKLVDGRKWTVLNQYSEMLVALIEASNLLYYVDCNDEKKLKLKRTF